MRVYWKELGGHTHMRICTGKTGYTLGRSGDLVFTNEEFRAWKQSRMLTDRVDGDILVEFREDVKEA
jgi:hypothetical protein